MLDVYIVKNQFKTLNKTCFLVYVEIKTKILDNVILCKNWFLSDGYFEKKKDVSYFEQDYTFGCTAIDLEMAGDSILKYLQQMDLFTYKSCYNFFYQNWIPLDSRHKWDYITNQIVKMILWTLTLLEEDFSCRRCCRCAYLWKNFTWHFQYALAVSFLHSSSVKL